MAIIEQSMQYLTFELSSETYGIEVGSIREILELQQITKVPRTATHLLGVMNVRGKVVPVVDLRLKFGLPGAGLTVDSAIIVLEVDDNGTEALIGLLVDGVDQVLKLGPESIEPAPKVGTVVGEQLLTGMGKQNDQFILLLNINAVFSTEDLEVASLQPGTADIPDDQLQPV